MCIWDYALRYIIRRLKYYYYCESMATVYVQIQSPTIQVVKYGAAGSGEVKTSISLVAQSRRQWNEVAKSPQS